MKTTKKAVRKSAVARKKSKVAKAARRERATISPCSVQILRNEPPPILFKYTTDAGVAGMREGIVRFGSYQSYREAEDREIRDEFENATITRPGLPFRHPFTGRVEFARYAMAYPGAIFCASADGSIGGAFPKYSRRVAVRAKPLFEALHNAVTQIRHVFDKSEDGKITEPRFRECGDHPRPSLDSFRKVRPKELYRELRMGQVRYVEDMTSKANPLDLLFAGIVGGDNGRRLIAKLTQDDHYSELWKQRRFEREKEWRVIMSFSPKNDSPEYTDQGLRILRCYHTDSFFVKIDNPQEVFIFDN